MLSVILTSLTLDAHAVNKPVSTPKQAPEKLTNSQPETVVIEFLIALQQKNYNSVKSHIDSTSKIHKNATDPLCGLKENYGLSYMVSMLPAIDKQSFTSSVELMYTGPKELSRFYDEENDLVNYTLLQENMHKQPFRAGAFVAIKPSDRIKASWDKEIPTALQHCLIFPMLKGVDNQWHVDVACLNMTIIGIGLRDSWDAKLNLQIGKTRFMPRYPNAIFNLLEGSYKMAPLVKPLMKP